MNDLEFVRKCSTGDKRSWDEFVDRYSRLVYSYIHSVFVNKGISVTQENIDDLFQEIFLSLLKNKFQKLKTFQAKNGSSLASWLRQVTVNYVIDYIRGLRPMVSIDQDNEDGIGLKDVLADSSSSIKDKLSAKDKLIQLKECIENLSQDDKYFVELHVSQGLDLDRISDHLGVRRGTLDMRKTRILERLRDCFRSKDFL